MNNKVNGPFLTLSDLYNDDIVYTSRPSYVSNPWLKPDEHQSNFLTGRELLIANRFPVIVHEASVTNKLEQLFKIVGREIPPHIYKFKDQETYESLIRNLALHHGKKSTFNIFMMKIFYLKNIMHLIKMFLLLLIIKHEFQNGLMTNIYHKEKLSQLKILNLVFKHGRIHLS